MKVKIISVILTWLFSLLAVFNFFVCSKAIMLGQWKNGGNVAFYLMLLCIILGVYASSIVRWVSKFSVRS